MIVLGIDTGVTGALAWWRDGRIISIEDMPCDEITINGKLRQRISDVRLLSLLRRFAEPVTAFIEIPEARPMTVRNRKTGVNETRQPGAAGMLSFGMSYGTVRTACVACGFKIYEVYPRSWKPKMGIRGSDDSSRRRAAEHFPNIADRLVRKSDNGRGDAILLAEFGAISLGLK